MLVRTSVRKDRDTSYTHQHTLQKEAGPSVSGGVSAMTDALADKHIAGKWRFST